MVENREKLVPGALCRHFKGNLYQIVTLAVHSETREECVVYQALYGDYGVYVRPLSMFLSEVDHEKYPEITQRWRFEFIDRSCLAEARKESLEKANTVANDGGRKQEPINENRELETITNKEAIEPEDSSDEGNLVNEDFLEFLDARSYKDKLAILVKMKNSLDEKTMNHIAISLDVALSAKNLEDQYEEVKNCLMTYMRYETGRLR